MCDCVFTIDYTVNHCIGQQYSFKEQYVIEVYSISSHKDSQVLTQC